MTTILLSLAVRLNLEFGRECTKCYEFVEFHLISFICSCSLPVDQILIDPITPVTKLCFAADWPMHVLATCARDFPCVVDLRTSAVLRLNQDEWRLSPKGRTFLICVHSVID